MLPLVGHVALHALEDCLRMLPFLLLAYLVIEWLERHQSEKMERLLARGGRFGFVPGALLGLVPQCGFSAMASNFYGSGVITLGTLMAVFISTSDEAIPIMLAQPESYPSLLALLGIKLVYALLVGLLLDVVLVRVLPKGLRGGYGGAASEVDCHEHHEHENLLVSVLRHTLNIFVVVWVFTFAFGLLVELAGEGRIMAFLGGLGPFQPLVAALFGLVPNCASSVLLTQLYLSGGIGFGTVAAGLSANAGIGLTVLFRANRNLKQNLFILGLLFALGSVLGLVLQALGL